MRAGPIPRAGGPASIAGPRKRDAIRVALAVQACLDAEGLAALLRTQRDLHLVGCARSCTEATRLCVRMRPRVLLLEALLPWPHEVCAYEAIRMCSPETRVLAVAPHPADRCAHLNPAPARAGSLFAPACRACLVSARAHGADGVLDRDSAPEALFAAVRALARGERWIGSGVAPDEAPRPPLSERELRVSLLVGSGQSNKEIASALEISEATVKKHIGHALRKLGLFGRLQLGLCVARHPESFEVGRT